MRRDMIGKTLFVSGLLLFLVLLAWPLYVFLAYAILGRVARTAVPIALMCANSALGAALLAILSRRRDGAGPGAKGLKWLSIAVAAALALYIASIFIVYFEGIWR
jgi:hypothetical protein